MLAGENKLYMDGQGIHIETDTSLLVSGDGEGDFNVTNFNKATFQPGSVGTPLVMSGGGSLSKPSVEWGGSASVNRVGRPTIFLGGNGGTVDIVDDPTTMVFSNRTGDGGFTLSFEATAGNHEAFIRDHSSNPIGIQYAADYSANYTARTLVDKGYVDAAISAGAFWPLTGTAALTGNVTINGGGTPRSLSLGSSGSRLYDFSVFADNDLSLYADNQALINVASGNNVNRVILQPGLSSFTLLDTDGMTLDVEILVQPGAADILRIVKDESVTVFEINADGSIVYGAPPTDCTGRATNTIWSDNGTLKLCP
jgi:hypothetical protein